LGHKIKKPAPMNTPQVQVLQPDFSVAAQLDEPALLWAFQAGFKSVVNNRPDFEGGTDQPTSDAMAAAAESAGLVYRYLPVLPAAQTPQDAAAMAELLQTLPKPILAFCRSGARSARLYAAAQALLNE
jgi:uncharacterized protein (TIGR01244 family)